jgi:hypothetical protein
MNTLTRGGASRLDTFSKAWAPLPQTMIPIAPTPTRAATPPVGVATVCVCVCVCACVRVWVTLPAFP